ncbi:Alanine dehydrogenase [Austwickia sp. TVS 96-490-7B]|uniref:ornithine cyclodeaminase family protein n=1 Tax=Austwickia sp. TVS 96-490-7B TaxID=2830843 RepID=UPI001C572F05|nr:ornithine cyclodeaminase family protein [Austwickia sp. TVS 96-490-7B]MBW3087079.1 Alanine dehydrogenase [Austwickia sp. TVS 96-490-7B]
MSEPHADPLLVLDATDIGAVYTPDVAIASQQEAFTALGEGHACQPERILMEGPDGSNVFCYAAKLGPRAPGVAKFGAVVPGNLDRGLPSISALVVVLDPDTGRPAAILDGATITTERTAAATAAALTRLARADADTLTIIGTGVQAEAHARLIAHALDLRHIRIVGQFPDQAEALAKRLTACTGVTTLAAPDVTAACTDAHIVVTCTTSTTPVLEDTDIPDGCTVVSIGSYAPDRTELPTALLARADLVVVDHGTIAAHHAGSVIAAVSDGAIRHEDIVEVGAVFAGTHPGRRTTSEVVVYNAVGIGVQDAAAAAAIVKGARAAGRGTPLQL